MIDAGKAAAYHQAAIATYQVSLYGLYTNAGVCDPIINGTVVDSVTARGSPNLITQITSVHPSSQLTVTEARKDLKEKQERFTCDECGKSVKSRNYLKLHKRTHTGEKPFACKQCSLSFSVRGNLYKHMRTHSGVKNYGCSYCGQMFRDSTSRNRHERLHTGEMPYRCEDCDQNFRYREMYKAHMMKTHGLDEEEVVSLPPGKRMKTEQSSSNSPGASSTPKSSTDAIRLNPKTVSSKCDDTVQKLSSAVQLSGNVVLKKESGLDGTGPKGKMANLSGFAYNTAAASTQCIGSEEQADMSSLTEEDGDMAFEDTSPYKLMPLELQNTDAISISRPEGPALLQQGKNRVEQLRCSKCPKTFDNKSQLTRHQKMHKLLSVVKNASHSASPGGSGSKVVTKKPGTARKTMRKQTHFVKVSTPDLPDSEAFSEENTLKSSLELSSLNPSSNSSSSQSGDHSIQIDASLPETFLQESVTAERDDSCSDTTRSRALSPAGESQEMLEVGDDVTGVTKVEDQSGSGADVSSLKGDKVAVEQSAQSSDNPDPSVSKDKPQSSNAPDPPGGIILDGCECKICGRVLSRESYLIIHMRSHSGEKPFVCQFCGRGFTVSQNLYKHVRTHTGEKNHACPTCGRRFTTSSSRNRHMLRHSGDKPYPCTLCDDGFSYLEQLKSHCQKNHAYFDTSLLKKVEIDTYELSKGKKKKKSKKKSKKLIVAPGAVSSFMSGKLIFPYDNPSQAAGNQGVISTQASLDHVQADSSGMLDPSLEISRQLSNIEAQAKIEDSNDLQGNMASSDPGQTKEGNSSRVRFMCTFCGSEFQSEHYLQHHMTIHKDERSYECPFCHQGFAMQAHLQAHLRNHADAKKYSCGICGKGFSVRSKLERHMLVHTGDKPNQCQLCQESFKYKHILKLHYRKMHPSFASSELAKKRGRPTKIEGPEGIDVSAESDGVSFSHDLEDGEVVLGMTGESGKPVSRPAGGNPDDITGLKSNGIQGRKTILRLLTGGDITHDSSIGCMEPTSTRTHSAINNKKEPGPASSEETSLTIQGDGIKENESNTQEQYKVELRSSGLGSPTACSFDCPHCPLIFQHKKDLTEHLLTHAERLVHYSDGNQCGDQSDHTGVSDSDPIINSDESDPSVPAGTSSSILATVSDPHIKDEVGRGFAASGVQPNVCDVCGAIFTATRKYRQHMADHLKLLESDKSSVEASSEKDKLRSQCETALQLAEDSQSSSSKTTSKVKRKGAAKSGLLPLNNSTSEEVCSICGDVFSTVELLGHHLKGHSDPVQDSRESQAEGTSSALTHTDSASADSVQQRNPSIKKEPEEYLPEHTPLIESPDQTRPDGAGCHDECLSEECHQVECRHCLAVFTSFKALHDHMKVHEGQSVFNCPLCSSVFHKQDQLLEHLKEHTGA